MRSLTTKWCPLKNYDKQEHKQEQGREQGRERECMIGVFDVNHKYGGAYLVPSKILYESVKAHDLMTGQSRAIVILRMGGRKKE